MSGKKKMNVHIASDAAMNQAFINAWQKAEKSEQDQSEEHLYFEDAATLLKVLSNQRLSLLVVLHTLGSTSIRALSKELRRDYKNVYDDVQILKQAGLIHETSVKKIYVPWTKIHTEIDLAA